MRCRGREGGREERRKTVEEHLRLLSKPEHIQEALGRDETSVCEPMIAMDYLMAGGEDKPGWLCGVTSYMIKKKYKCYIHFILNDYMLLN